jgi:hypothetical protein
LPTSAETTTGETVDPSATISGDVGILRTSSTIIGARSAFSVSSSISAGVEVTHRSCGVIASHRSAARLPSRSARSRCSHVRVSVLYQRSP